MKLFKVLLIICGLGIFLLVGFLFLRPKPVEWTMTENQFAPDFILKKYLPRDTARLEGKAELYYKGKLVKDGLDNYNDFAFPKVFKETDQQIFIIVNQSDLKEVMQAFGYIDKKDDSWHDLPVRDGLLDIENSYFLFQNSTVDYVEDKVNQRIIIEVSGFDAKVFNYGLKEACLLPLKYNNWYLADAKFVLDKDGYVAVVADSILEPTQNIVLLGTVGCKFSVLKKVIPENQSNFYVESYEKGRLIVGDASGVKETVIIK